MNLGFLSLCASGLWTGGSLVFCIKRASTQLNHWLIGSFTL